MDDQSVKPSIATLWRNVALRTFNPAAAPRCLPSHVIAKPGMLITHPVSSCFEQIQWARQFGQIGSNTHHQSSFTSHGFVDPFILGYKCSHMLTKHGLESRVSCTSDFDVPSRVTFFFSFLWASTCKDVGKSTFHLSPADRVQLQNPVWMRKLIASETSSNDRWIPAIVVLLHRHDLGGNSRKLESTLMHKSGLVVLRQHVINFQRRRWHFGGKDSKHQGLSSFYESILLGLAGKRGQGSHSFEDSQMQSIGSACWHFGILKSSIHTLI